MSATDTQMQAFANERMRPRAEAIRALVAAMQSDKDVIDDVYNRANGGPSWNDARTDGPPHLLTEQSALQFNAFITSVLAAMTGHAEYHHILEMCVRAP